MSSAVSCFFATIGADGDSGQLNILTACNENLERRMDDLEEAMSG